MGHNYVKQKRRADIREDFKQNAKIGIKEHFGLLGSWQYTDILYTFNWVKY